ncbi:MAG: right-handed parallel beta-helix repeat-containing protein [Bacteroidales bacterium]|nr:right-handed parallel beta-helix repeat-containing protein [Bacteroidales bacterium]
MKTRTILSVMMFWAMACAATAEEIVVKSAREFIQALGPERTIVIDSRSPLIITPALDELASSLEEYELSNNDYGIFYVNHHDGKGLLVGSFNNLTIRAKEGTTATLLSQPRYADVMTFVNCENLTIENIVMGHTEAGFCDRGVLGLTRCRGVNVDNCDFFGCGTEGFIISKCERVNIANSCVHDCTYYTMHVEESEEVSFKNCTFRDNREYEQINVYNTTRIDFTNCTFKNLQGPLFSVNNRILFTDCHFSGCRYDFRDKNKNIVLAGNCTYEDCNDFESECSEEYADEGYQSGRGDLTGKWTDGVYDYDVIMEGHNAYFQGTVPGDFIAVPHNFSKGKWEMMGHNGEVHDIFDLHLIENEDGPDMLVVLDDGHTVMDCYYELTEGNEEHSQPDVLLPFYGSYRDKEGNLCQIKKDHVMLPGAAGPYHLLSMFEFPQPILCIDNKLGEDPGQLFMVLTEKGVNIHKTILNEEEGAFPGELLHELTYDYDYERVPRWYMLMSEQIRPNSAFAFVPSDLLPLMRNLPYAMQGFKFGKAQLSNYFTNQPWYEPADRQVTISKFEEFNCDLIKHIERDRKRLK